MSYLISFFVYQSTFAANELVSDKINKNIKKGGVIEKSTNKIIQYPSTTAINLKAKQLGMLIFDYRNQIMDVVPKTVVCYMVQEFVEDLHRDLMKELFSSDRYITHIHTLVRISI